MKLVILHTRLSLFERYKIWRYRKLYPLFEVECFDLRTPAGIQKSAAIYAIGRESDKLPVTSIEHNNEVVLAWKNEIPNRDELLGAFEEVLSCVAIKVTNEVYEIIHAALLQIDVGSEVVEAIKEKFNEKHREGNSA